MNKKRAGALLGIRLLLSIIFVIKYVNSRKHKEKRMEERKNLAFLSNSGNYSIFQFQNDVIRFMTSPRLEKYQKVLEWDAGYLVVIAKYKDLAEMEEYIDLVPILEDLSYDVDSFLSHIVPDFMSCHATDFFACR